MFVLIRISNLLYNIKTTFKMKKIFAVLTLAVLVLACSDDDYDPEIKVDSSNLFFINEGGSKTVNLSSNTTWNVSVDQSWVKASVLQGGSSQALEISAEPNSTGVERTAVITIKSIFTPVVTKTIKIRQGDLTVNTKQLNYFYQASTQELIVYIEGDWTLEKADDWFTLSAESGKGTSVIDITTKPNDSKSARSGIITLKSAGNVDVEIKVQQAKLPELIGLYILSEGSWNANQADLAYYDFATATISKKYYKTQNGTTLGDTGNDLAIYGGKMYCVVSGASVAAGGGHIEIIDIETGKSQKKIEFKDIQGGNDMPRRIAFYKNKAYITGYSGMVARLDTTSLEIDGKVALSGTYPEGITQYGGKLYVCNSGQGYDNKISVIDIASLKESKVITVAQNPYNIAASSTGEIYFNTADLSWLTTGGIPSNLYLLDAKTETVTKTFDVTTTALSVGNDYVYIVDNYTNWTTFESIDYSFKIDRSSYQVSDFTSEIPSYFMAYKVNANPYNGDIYMGGQGQDVAIFGADGSLKTKLKTGTGFTNSIVPVYK